ncbi:MAG: hypothetical protein G01um101433_841 [Parcubacteria group bacterium Gr01-1014_33]|nr:MAG: hypothetical protein G01um101433_841 [Parcubacteria group bacterium Gr01-1014_33]
MRILRGHSLKSPAKTRVFLGFLLFFAIAASVFFLLPPSPKRPNKIADAPLASLKREEELKELNSDADNDGLKLWEENIFHTNPNNPDTDGDGTNDGEEIKRGRNPLKPGLDDKLPPTQLKDIKESSAVPINLTADFAERFLKEPISQAIAGEVPAIDQVNIQNYAENLANRSVLSSAPKITKADITIAGLDTQNFIERYFQEFTIIFNTLKSRGVNELDIALQSLKSQQYDELEKLDDYVTIYGKTISDLEKLPTPPILESFHLTTLNYVSKFKHSVELIRNTESDPLQAILAINERIALEDEFKNFLAQSQQKIISELQQHL